MVFLSERHPGKPNPNAKPKCKTKPDANPNAKPNAKPKYKTTHRTVDTAVFATKCWHNLPRAYFSKRRLKVGGHVFFNGGLKNKSKTGNPGFESTMGIVLEIASLDEWIVQWWDEASPSRMDAKELSPAPAPGDILQFKDDDTVVVLRYCKRTKGRHVQLKDQDQV